MRTALGLLLVAALSSGCATRLGDLSLVASKSVGLTPEVMQRGVEGEDCVHLLLFLPLGSLNPNLQEAMDNALAKVPEANAMSDLAVYNDTVFTLIYNRTCLRVRGDVGRLP